MKKLLPYLKPYTKECIIAPLLKCTEALVDLFVPLLIARLIDDGILAGSKTVIIQVGLSLLGLAVAGLALAMIAQWFSAKAAVGFATSVRSDLFRHIESFSFQTADKTGTSTLITRLTSDINQTQSGINMALRLLLRSPFIVFGSLIMAYQVDAGSAWIFLAVIPLLAIVVYGVMWITVPLYKKVQSRLDGVLRSTRENLTGVRVIRAFNLQSLETKGFLEQTDVLTRESMHVGRISSLTNPLTYVLINLATALLIYVGAIRVNIGELSQGDVVALLNYMAQILVELVKLANLIITITKALASAGRIESVLDTTSDQEAPKQSDLKVSEGAVSFENVSFCYAGAGAPSLSSISFQVKPGQTVGVIGSTGSGKTSLVDLIPRFYDATEGSVLVDGHNVQEYALDDLRGSIGVVAQKAVLFAGTIRENMQFGNKEATDDEIMEALKIAQADSFVLEKPGKLDEPIEQGGRNLSGGQRQRLSIARALVRKPRILIMDDSSSALDFATDLSLRKALRSLSFHPTTFIVSQRISSIMHADQILVLSEGELAGCGSHEELLDSCDVYREIYHSQFKEEGEGGETA